MTTQKSQCRILIIFYHRITFNVIVIKSSLILLVIIFYSKSDFSCNFLRLLLEHTNGPKEISPGTDETDRDVIDGFEVNGNN